MDRRRNQKEVRKYFELNKNETQHQNLLDATNLEIFNC